MGEEINDADSWSPTGGSPKSKSKKKRNSNFSRDEIKCLVSEFGNRSNLLNFGTRDQKQKCWEEITEQINLGHRDFTRSVSEVKKKWIDLLYDTKKQYIKATTDAETNGSSKRRKLNDIAEMIVKVKGGFASKLRNDGEMKVINFEFPSEETENGTNCEPTAFFIPNIEDCNSSGEEQSMNHNEDQKLSAGEVIHLKPVESNSVIDSITHYETYSEMLPESSGTCSCGLTADFLRLKQEEIGLAKRIVQIEEERRLEEKQKWWEAKALIRLQKQKLELEIKTLIQSLPQSNTDT